MKIVSQIVLCVLVAASVGAGEWHTYHGDFALTGVSADAFPDKPERLWRTKVGTELSSPVVGSEGGLFCVADETTVTALDANGSERWTRIWPITNVTGEVRNERFTAPPLHVHRGLLVVASEGGNVYGLSPANGKTQWRYASGGQIQGTPNYDDGQKRKSGRVLVLTQGDGTMHAVSAADGRKLWVSEPMNRTDGHMAVSQGAAMFGNCAATLFAVDLSSGRKSSAVLVGEGCEMAGGAAALGSLVYAGNRSGSLACADLQQESLCWVNTNGVGGVFTTPAVAGSRIVSVSGDGVVYGVDRTSGRSQWSFDTGGMDPLSPVIAGDGVIAVVDGTLYGLSLEDGVLQWKLAISDEITSPSIIDGMIVVGTDDGYVAAYGIGD